jgi:hypothetical protein
MPVQKTRYPKLAPIAGSLLGLSALLLPAAAKAATPDTGSQVICLARPLGTWCLDLAHNKTKPGNPVYIFGAGGTGFNWVFSFREKVCADSACGGPAPFSGGSHLNSKYKGKWVIYIEKREGSGHDGCLSVTRQDARATWEPCGKSGTRWVWDKKSSGTDGKDGYLVSVAASNARHQAEVLTANSAKERGFVTAQPLGGRGWQYWSVRR